MEDDLQLGFELTFVPRKRGQWQEYRDEDEAKRDAAALNAAFAKDALILQARSAECADERLPLFTAKADPFRVTWIGQPHRAWCIEIHNQPLRADADAAVGNAEFEELAELVFGQGEAPPGP